MLTPIIHVPSVPTVWQDKVICDLQWPRALAHCQQNNNHILHWWSISCYVLVGEASGCISATQQKIGGQVCRRPTWQVVWMIRSQCYEVGFSAVRLRLPKGHFKTKCKQGPHCIYLTCGDSTNLESMWRPHMKFPRSALSAVCSWGAGGSGWKISAEDKYSCMLKIAVVKNTETLSGVTSTTRSWSSLIFSCQCWWFWELLVQ